MKTPINEEKTGFFTIWILLSSILIPVGAILGYIVVISVQGIYRNYISQTCPSFIGTIDYCISISTIGVVISLKQWLLLRKQIGITLIWILACIGGIVIGESLAGIVLLKLDISREGLGWPQNGPILPEALIFMLSGALIGLFQYLLLRRYYHKAGFWILACCIGWGLIPVAIYFLGGIVLGAITGVTLTWYLQPKEIKP